jgi:hypothetical protein
MFSVQLSGRLVMGRPPARLDEYLDWQQRLEIQKASGLSVPMFCLSETGYQGVPDGDVQNEAHGFGEDRSSLSGTTKQETTGKTT